MAEVLYRGACLCGAVQLALTAVPATVGLCHCRHCQKQSGSAFSAFMVVPTSQVALAGELRSFEDSGDDGAPVLRHFCGTCGSPVQTTSAKTQAQGISVIKAALLDLPGIPAPQIQVFCDHGLPWMPQVAGTVRFNRMPPA